MDYISKNEVLDKLEEIIISGWGRKRINRELRSLVKEGRVEYDGRNTNKARSARRRILTFVRERGEVTLPEIAEELDTSYQFAQKMVKFMVDDGLLKNKGTKRRKKHQSGRLPNWYEVYGA